MVSSKGGRAGFVYADQHARYRALRRGGKTKTAAARIANAWHNGTVSKRRATSRRRKR